MVTVAAEPVKEKKNNDSRNKDDRNMEKDAHHCPENRFARGQRLRAGG